MRLRCVALRDDGGVRARALLAIFVHASASQPTDWHRQKSEIKKNTVWLQRW